MRSPTSIRRPLLARHARYRRDAIRQQHQLVFPEGVLVLNDSGAAIIQLCDGRSIEAMIAALKAQCGEVDPAADVHAFLNRLAAKGLVRDAAES
jgi:pyrroloquinoline quinone biosynthesis protein D